MNKQDWYDCGARIGDLVQSAIDSNDFKQLNQSITDAVNTAMDMLKNGTGNSGSYTPDGGSAYQKTQESEQQENGWSSAKRYTGAGYGKTWKEIGRNAYEQAMSRAGYKIDKKVSANKELPEKATRSYKGIVYMAVGYTFLGIFGFMAAGFGTLSAFWGGFSVAVPFLCAGAAGFGVMGVHGSVLNGRSKRQKHYLQIMGDRDMCTLEELSDGVGKSRKFVLKDLKKMIQTRMFPQGAYLDAQETCLMTSRDAYRQYQETMKQYELRKNQEAQVQEHEESLSAEAQDILQEGREFIAHIHECNDEIPGREISEKLDRLESVVTRIFNQVAKNPESAPDLHKMMSYYLPITRKLVDAYRDMDAQHVHGENIAKTKKEIEDFLDTINQAFENLLDEFFRDTAWDISSDISVLHTMMAQDGLMKKDFESK